MVRLSRNVTVPLILSEPSPLPRGPVQGPHKATPPLRSSISPKGPRLGFHAHKMPEIKAERTTWKVLKLAQDRGHEIPRDLALLLGSTIKQGLGPGQKGGGWAPRGGWHFRSDLHSNDGLVIPCFGEDSWENPAEKIPWLDVRGSEGPHGERVGTEVPK